MGALTLKSFPFELRGWEIEKFESIDPTDGFGSSTRVYVSKDQIVQIEPEYDTYTFNNWITDKSRQFYDGTFNNWLERESTSIKGRDWYNFTKALNKTLYFLKNNNKQLVRYNFFIIVFEFVSLEVLGLLAILSQNCSFLKVKKSQNSNLNNDLESNFQLNLISDKPNFSISTLGLLVSTNLRYEGYQLNLSLRQKFLKGNFRCLVIGSLINLTFPTQFIGSNLKALKTICKGNQLLCQNISLSKNPLLILNDEVLKRNDSKNILKLVKSAKCLNVFNKTWNGINLLNSSLNDTGTLLMTTFLPLNPNDLLTFNSMYFLNITINNNSNFKKVTEIRLLKSILLDSYQTLDLTRLIGDQTSVKNRTNLLHSNFLNLKGKNIFKSLLTSMFYANKETFINTDGFAKRTNRLLTSKKTRNNWQLLRKMLKLLKKITFIADKKTNQISFFDTERVSNFMNFACFHYFATKSLTNLNFYLFTKTSAFIFNSEYFTFRLQSLKLHSTKLKYWLDDFYTGGKDEYSQNSLTMINCSEILRSETTIFF